MEINDIVVMDTVEVMIFDEEGNLIDTLTDTQEFEMDQNEIGTFVKFKKALYSQKLVEFMGKTEKKSDFEVSVSRNSSSVSIGANKSKKAKIIAYTIGYDPETMKPNKNLRLIFPNVTIKNRLKMRLVAGEVLTPTYEAIAEPFDNEDNTVIVELCDRK